MTTNNTWPDAETYVPLTLEMALASKQKTGSLSSCLPVAAAISSLPEACDDKTDSYVDSPLTVPHLIAMLDASGPNISEFPLPVRTLLDIGCPSTVISSALVDELRLRQYPLPPEEDNLSSLSELPLSCKEYIKLELSGVGSHQRSELKLILVFLYPSFLECHSCLPITFVMNFSSFYVCYQDYFCYCCYQIVFVIFSYFLGSRICFIFVIFHR